MTTDQAQTLRHVERLYGPVELRGERGGLVLASAGTQGPLYVEPNGDYCWGDPPQADA